MSKKKFKGKKCIVSFAIIMPFSLTFFSAIKKNESIQYFEMFVRRKKVSPHKKTYDDK